MKIKFDTKTLKELLNPTPDLRKELNVIYKKAACTGCPSEYFFPGPYKGRIAKNSPVWHGLKICSSCQVKQECYNFAAKHKCIGVWGGVLFGTEGPTKMKSENPS